MKDTLRKRMLDKRLALTREERERRGVIVLEKLLSLREVRLASNIALYYPIKGELDPLPLVNMIGRSFFLPKVVGRDLRFGKVDSALVKGAFGIMEPKEAPFTFEDMDLFVVPAVAYDEEGYRLGYGGGYYDRLLKRKLPHQVAVGVCFDVQLVGSLPKDPWDVPVDVVVTESRLLRPAVSTKILG